MTDDQFLGDARRARRGPIPNRARGGPHMRDAAKPERARGLEVFRKIVSVSLISGVMGNAGQINHSTARAGRVGMTEALAREWGQFRVNVYAVAFEFGDTQPMAPTGSAETLRRGSVSVALGIPAEMRDAMAETIPLRRRRRATRARAESSC
jgi:3-oxoacyl-[acyl-carrier protein] reductase